MKNSLTIASVRGIKIRLHVSWLLVLAILTYALATGFFPMRYEFETVTNWALGAASALLLFISVFLHEALYPVGNSEIQVFRDLPLPGKTLKINR